MSLPNTYTAAQLQQYLADAAAHEREAKQLKSLVKEVILQSYETGNQPGTYTFEELGYEIKVTRPKTVKWDNEKLADAEAKIRDHWGSDPAEYITTKRTVSESKYKAWPKDIQKMFVDARTVTTGAERITIEDKSNG